MKAQSPLRKITERVLIQHGACDERETFVRLYPEGVEPSNEVVDAHYRELNFAWVADVLLDHTGQNRYLRDRRKSEEARHEAIRVAQRARNRTQAQFTPDQDEYWNAGRDYDRAVWKAEDEHKRRMGYAFVAAFKEHAILVGNPDGGMDPDATLNQIRELLRQAQYADNYDARNILRNLASELKELDESLSQGGRRPEEWIHRRTTSQPAKAAAAA